MSLIEASLMVSIFVCLDLCMVLISEQCNAVEAKTKALQYLKAHRGERAIVCQRNLRTGCSNCFLSLSMAFEANQT